MLKISFEMYARFLLPILPSTAAYENLEKVEWGFDQAAFAFFIFVRRFSAAASVSWSAKWFSAIPSCPGIQWKLCIWEAAIWQASFWISAIF